MISNIPLQKITIEFMIDTYFYPGKYFKCICESEMKLGVMIHEQV